MLFISQYSYLLRVLIACYTGSRQWLILGQFVPIRNRKTFCTLTFNTNALYISVQLPVKSINSVLYGFKTTVDTEIVRSDPKQKDILYINIQYKRSLYFSTATQLISGAVNNIGNMLYGFKAMFDTEIVRSDPNYKHRLYINIEHKSSLYFLSLIHI